MRRILCLILLMTAGAVFAYGAAEVPILKEAKISFTKDEIKYIQKIHEEKNLRVATTLNWDTYQPMGDGTIRGFHYNFAKEFASALGVELKVTSFEAWDTFFLKKGKSLEKAKTDPLYSYTPDLFMNNEIYIAGITSLPWREKLFAIIKMVPTKQMIIFRKDSGIKKIEDLNGKTLALVKGTSMESNVLQWKEEKKIEVNILYCERLEDTEKYVDEKKADATIHDSDNAFISIKNYKDLTVGFPVSKLEVMGWGVEKENKVLQSILEKYFKYARENGILDKYWKESYGVTFKEYINVVDYK